MWWSMREWLRRDEMVWRMRIDEGSD